MPNKKGVPARITDYSDRIRIPEHWDRVHNMDAYQCSRCGTQVTGKMIVSARKGVPIFRHVCREDYLLLPADGEYQVRLHENGMMIYKNILVSE